MATCLQSGLKHILLSIQIYSLICSIPLCETGAWLITEFTDWTWLMEHTSRRLQGEKVWALGIYFPSSLPAWLQWLGCFNINSQAPVKCSLSIDLSFGLSKSLVSSGVGVARVGKSPCSKHSKTYHLSIPSASCCIPDWNVDQPWRTISGSPNNVVLKIQRLANRPQ